MALEELKKYRSFIYWFKEPKATGGFRKVPYRLGTNKEFYPLSVVKECATGGKRFMTYTEICSSYGKEYSRHRGQDLPTVTAAADGIGFVFQKSNNIIGIDIDDCIKNKQINNSAWEILNYFDSYAEISPSGKGLHIYIIVDGIDKNQYEKGKRQKQGLEVFMYDSYMTVTGQGKGEIKTIVREKFDLWFKKNFPKEDLPPVSTAYSSYRNSSLSCEKAFEFVMNQSDGIAREIYNGDYSRWNNDKSSATLSILCKLYWITGGDRMLSLQTYEMFTDLASREKAKHKNYYTWLADSLEKAIKFVEGRGGVRKWKET